MKFQSEPTVTRMLSQFRDHEIQLQKWMETNFVASVPDVVFSACLITLLPSNVASKFRDKEINGVSISNRHSDSKIVTMGSRKISEIGSKRPDERMRSI